MEHEVAGAVPCCLSLVAAGAHSSVLLGVQHVVAGIAVPNSGAHALGVLRHSFVVARATSVLADLVVCNVNCVLVALYALEVISFALVFVFFKASGARALPLVVVILGVVELLAHLICSLDGGWPVLL
jgi:hypothetical protein